jgi:hypothetical protein
VKQDIETIFFKLVDQVKATINDKIDGINVEKDDCVLKNIDDQAWIIGSLDDRIKSFNTFAFTYIDSVTSTTQGNIVSKNASFEFDICIAENEDGSDYLRVLRYHRVLEECMIEAWDKVCKGYDRPTINLLNPIDIKLYDSSHLHKVVGIQVEFTLVN